MRRLVLLVVAALVLGACSSDDSGSAATTASAPTTAAATTAPSSTTDSTVSSSTSTESAAAGSLDWKLCPDAGPRIECATLTVPVDSTNAASGTINLALMRLPASNPSDRIGSMLVNPGGPGVPGTELIPQATSIWPRDIRDRFDIVAWDPRGTGSSAPIDCVADVDRYFAEPDPSPDTPAEKQELIDRAQEFDNACEKADGPMLSHISTVDTANDMERIRQALGETTITYFGFSYGSELGATYATLFPTHIRAMVLDGAIDPDLNGVETAHAQAVGAEHALDSFLADCSAHRTCAFNNNGNAEGAFDALMAKLDANPLPPPEKGRPSVGQGVALNAVIQALYSVDLWPSLANALDDAQHGNGDGLLALSDSYLERNDNGTWSNTIEAFIAISCLDDPVPRDLSAYDALADQFAKDAPRLGRSFAYGYQCALWPVPPKPGPTATGAGAPPILIVGTTGDPFTPLEQTKQLADAMESGVLLVREGEGHTAYGEDKCIDDAVDAYILNLTVPKDGTQC